MDFFGPGNSRVETNRRKKNRSEKSEALTNSTSSASIVDSSVASTAEVEDEVQVGTSSSSPSIEDSEVCESSMGRSESKSDFLTFSSNKSLVHCESEIQDK